MQHLAQMNIGRLIAPLDHPRIADFLAQLDSVNALAEQSRGFLWRLKSDSGNATDIPYSDDPLVIVNMSVWESVEALRDFTYASKHVDVLRDRAKWFEKAAEPTYCLWWIAAGHVPTVAEGAERLDRLRRHGPTPFAFSFAQQFGPIEAAGESDIPTDPAAPADSPGAHPAAVKTPDRTATSAPAV